MARQRLGELLLQRALINKHQLEAALHAQRLTKQRLGATLVAKGFISEPVLLAALAEALNVPTVLLANVSPDWAAVHTLRSRFCETNEIFPYAFENQAQGGRRLLVAMADPLNTAPLQEIEFTTGLTAVPRLAPLSAVREAILRYYHKVNPHPAGSRAPTPAAPRRVEAPAIEDDDDRIVMGMELAAAGDPELEALIKRKQDEVTTRRLMSAGATTDSDDFQKLEKKFWALMRLMARKGLITKEEFSAELDDSEDEG